eukprot:gb/GFBE01055880.1/.p1 GENE.gb/GFBE01055880.1/~~gb/GFBE01055880.1/.p1  ORF type:complete len:217 (+),score=27.99 gb/GFBE01055880.1/:1-651(+)
MGSESSSLSPAGGGDVLASPFEASRSFSWQDTFSRPSRHSVQVALTSLSPQMATVLGVPTAYHSSVIVDGEEYSFSKAGLVRARNFLSHRHLNGPTHVIDLGSSQVSGMDMAKALRNYFKPNTYDLLLKNCNHFSDCALFFMMGARLPDKYKAAEALGASMEKTLGLIKMLSMGDYVPNPEALSFDLLFVLGRVGCPKRITESQAEVRRRVANAGG